MSDKEQLRDWINANMSAETTDELDRWKEKVAALLSLGPTGNVVVKVDPNKLDATDHVLLQLLGRTYAEVGGKVENAAMANADLKAVVPAPPGTVDRVLLELRRNHLVDSQNRGEHRLIPSRVGAVVSRLSSHVDE
jgi:hypothetical protein